MKKYKIMVLILTIQSILTLNAQWNFSSSISQEYDSNPFHSPFPVSSNINSFDFGIENTGKTFDVSYSGSYNIYQSYSDANFYWQQLALFSDTDSISWGGVFDKQDE